MYDLRSYGRMIADEGRLSAYTRALEARVTPGAVVLDIGAGPGIMSFLACRAGAARVYAIEPADVIEVAREAAAANGLSNHIQFIPAMSTAIDLPEKVDGIVADLRGVLPVFGAGIASVLDARERFLKPGGWIVAGRDTLWAALLCAPERHHKLISGWDMGHGFDFSRARGKVLNSWGSTLLKPEEVRFEPKPWATVDYHTLTTPNVSGEAAWTADHDVVAHGIGVWFDTETAPGIGFSNSPLSGETHVYRQAFFPWPQPTELRAGAAIRASFRANFVREEYIWTWTTDITGPTPNAVPVHYKQSTFLAGSLSSAHLQKRAHTFVATPNGASTIDRRILDLMDQQMALGAIADALVAEFPDQFSSWEAALTRAGDISERYSA